MKSSIYVIGFILFSSFASVSSLQSQETWSVQQCIAYAFEHSLILEQNMYTNELDLINLTQSRKSRNPNLTFNGDLTARRGRSVNFVTGLPENSTAIDNGFSLGSSVVVFDGFRIKNTIEQNRLNALASKLDIESNKSNIALNVATAYLNVLQAKERLKENDATLTLSQKQLDRIDKQISAGSVPKNDRLNILAQISGNEQQIIAGQNNVDIALLNLYQAMNYQKDENFDVEDLPEVLVEEDPFTIQFEELYREAEANFLQANEARYKSAEMGVDVAKSGKYPSLSASGGIGTGYYNSDRAGFVGEKYFTQLNDQLSYQIGLNLRMPIFDNYNTKSNIERAKVNLAITENQNSQSEQQLRSNVQLVITDARAAKKQVESAEITMEAQKAAFENAEKRFELGAINSYDLINANNQYNSAKINHIISKYDYLFRMKILDIYRGKPVSLD